MLSTDHPNGGSFLSYPKLIRHGPAAPGSTQRQRRANQRAIRRTALPDGLDREYTLNEIAIITRAAPARRLGLRDKGHLGIGADPVDVEDGAAHGAREPRRVEAGEGACGGAGLLRRRSAAVAAARTSSASSSS